MSKKIKGSSIQSKRDSRKDLIVVIILGIVLIVFAGSVIFYFKVGQPLLAPKTTVIFEPDSTLIGSAVAPATLEETAQILKQRWSYLGYGNLWTSFVVSDDRQIIGKIPAKFDSNFINLTKATGVIEFVDFGKKPIALGTTVATDYTFGYQKSEGTQWHTLISGGQIHTISLLNSGRSGNYEILFSLTDTGKTALLNYSTENTNSYLGILMDKVVT